MLGSIVYTTTPLFVAPFTGRESFKIQAALQLHDSKLTLYERN